MSTPAHRRLGLPLIVALLAGTLLPGASPLPARAVIYAPYLPSGALPVAPGATHEWGALATGYGNQRVNIVSADLGSPALSVEAAISNDRVGGLERTTSMAIARSRDGHRVVAAVNADVWSGTGSLLGQAPNGIHIQGGELVTADGLTRATFGIGPDRWPRMEQVGVTITMTTATGATFPIQTLNQAPAELGLFTRRFGPRTSTALGGREVVIGGLALPLTPSGSWSGTVRTIRSAGGHTIPDDAVVLVAPPDSLALLDLQAGAPVSFSISITPGWEGVTEAVSGRGFLVRDGQVAISSRPADGRWTHPRTALGLTGDGRLLLLTVDGRGSGSRGIDIDDLASLLVSRGAVTAINLDGGSSSTMAVRRPGDVNVSLANTPSAGYEIRVTNSLQIVSTVPTGPLAFIGVSPVASSVYPTRHVSLRAGGMDAAYNGIRLAPSEIAWAVDPAIGRIDADGRFTAVGAGIAQVSATARGATGTATIEVLPDLVAPQVRSLSVVPRQGPLPKTAALTLDWPATTDAESGLARYELEEAVDGGEFAPVPLPPSAAAATGLSLPLARYRTYAFRVRPVDRVGNAGDWRTVGPFRLTVAQESAAELVRSGRWTVKTGRTFDGKATLASTKKGSAVTYSFVGTAIGWVAARGPGYGRAAVSVDGGPAVTVDLHAARSATRRVVWARSWSSVGPHTVTITVLGTRRHPRVDVDGFVILAPG